MIKIEIKNRFTGKVIFEYEKHHNNITLLHNDILQQRMF